MLYSLRPNSEWGVEKKYAGWWKIRGLRPASKTPDSSKQMPICEMPSSPKRLGIAGCETSHAVAAKELIAMPDFFLSCVR